MICSGKIQKVPAVIMHDVYILQIWFTETPLMQLIRKTSICALKKNQKTNTKPFNLIRSAWWPITRLQCELRSKASCPNFSFSVCLCIVQPISFLVAVTKAGRNCQGKQEEAMYSGCWKGSAFSDFWRTNTEGLELYSSTAQPIWLVDLGLPLWGSARPLYRRVSRVLSRH